MWSIQRWQLALFYEVTASFFIDSWMSLYGISTVLCSDFLNPLQQPKPVRLEHCKFVHPRERDPFHLSSSAINLNHSTWNGINSSMKMDSVAVLEYQMI